MLDEADEMLRMGFVDAVESILEQTPPQRQVALFSATIPAPIRRIAPKHLRSPVEVTIKSKTSTATNIRQRYWMVSGMHKLDALTRILEAETFDGMLVFTRTKQSTVELAEKLEARGFAAAPLNGDIPQPQRERTVARLKAGQIDILVATDVAARGLDVERIGHVVNYDVPYDTESYVHRIGRTGRAGRKGEAILFIAPRERNMLRAIERATRQVIEPMNLPTVDAVNTLRIAKFKQRVIETVRQGRRQRSSGRCWNNWRRRPGCRSSTSPPRSRACRRGRRRCCWRAKRGAAGAGACRPDASARRPTRAPATRPSARPRESRARAARTQRLPNARAQVPRADPCPGSMETFRIEVGSVHGIKPGNIVGAIANEAGIEGVHIGRVDIREDHSFVDLPEGMPKQIFKDLQKVRVAGRELRISRVSEKPPKPPRDPTRPACRAQDAEPAQDEALMSSLVDTTRGVSHGQGHGSKERRQEEADQDVGREARRETGKEGSQRLMSAASLPGRQSTRDRVGRRAGNRWMFAAISSRQRCRASRAAQATCGVSDQIRDARDRATDRRRAAVPAAAHRCRRRRAALPSAPRRAHGRRPARRAPY